MMLRFSERSMQFLGVAGLIASPVGDGEKVFASEGILGHQEVLQVLGPSPLESVRQP